MADGMRGKEVFAFVVGGLYIMFGALQILAGLGMRGGWSEALLLGGGGIDGFIMVVIGLVFLQGHRELRSGLHEGVAFVYVGILLAMFFLIVQLTQISVSYLGSWTVGGDWADYSAQDTVSPFLYLSPLPLFGLILWKGGFSLTPRGAVPAGGVGLNNLEGD